MDGIKNAAVIDDLESGVTGIKRVVVPGAIGGALLSEMTIGNEIVVAGVGTRIAETMHGLSLTGRPLLDVAIATGTAFAGTGTFSYLQQRAYGEVTRRGLRRFPRTIRMVGSIANSRTVQAEDKLGRTDGNDALAIGTSASLIRHVVNRQGNVDEEREKRVIHRGAKAIAVFWGSVMAVATAVTAGADKVENNWVLQDVSSATKPSTLAGLALGGAILGSWGMPVYRKVVGTKENDGQHTVAADPVADAEATA